MTSSNFINIGLDLTLYWLLTVTISIVFIVFIIYVLLKIFPSETSKTTSIVQSEKVEAKEEDGEELELAAAISAITYYLSSTSRYGSIKREEDYETSKWRLTSIIYLSEGGE